MSHDYEIIINQSDSLSCDKFGYKFTSIFAKSSVQFSEFLPWSALP